MSAIAKPYAPICAQSVVAHLGGIMNITFCDGMLLQVTLHDNKATVISKQEIGTETIDFYNYFAKYRLSPKEQLLTLSNCPDKEAIEIISGQPLVNQFFLDCINSRTTIYPQSKQSATEEALTYTCNLVQYAFSDLDAAFSERPGTDDTSTQRFDKTVYLFTHEELEDGQTVFKPNQFTTSFVLLDNKIVLVYTVKSLYEYLALDFYHIYFSSDSVKQVAVCPCCKRAFRMSQRNNLYCSKSCKDKHIKANNKKSPYYSKYRYLQQYHNRQLNELRSQMTDSSPQVQKLQGIYDTWNEWAHSEYEQATKTYNLMQQEKFKFFINVNAYRQAQANNSFPDFETESTEEFGERLKAKWQELKRGAK